MPISARVKAVQWQRVCVGCGCVLLVYWLLLTRPDPAACRSCVPCTHHDQLCPTVKDCSANWPHAQSAVDWVKEHIKPPTPDTVPYKLVRADSADWSQFNQMPIIHRDHLDERKNGRFLEMEKKARKAWRLHGCLLNVRQPTSTRFEFFGPLGQLDLPNRTNRIAHADHRSVTCVPVSAVLQALGWHRLDLLSVDTEGSEPELLLSVPWHLVDIDVVQVECNQCDNPSKRHPDFVRKRGFLKTFMDAQGYDEVAFIQLDFVYKKRRPKTTTEPTTA